MSIGDLAWWELLLAGVATAGAVGGAAFVFLWRR